MSVLASSRQTPKWRTGEIAMKHFSMILVVLCGLNGPVIAQTGALDSSRASQVPLYKDPHADIEARIADLVGRMSASYRGNFERLYLLIMWKEKLAASEGCQVWASIGDSPMCS